MEEMNILINFICLFASGMIFVEKYQKTEDGFKIFAKD